MSQQKTVSFSTDTIESIEIAKEEFEREQSVTLTYSAFVEKLVKMGLDKYIKN